MDWPGTAAAPVVGARMVVGRIRAGAGGTTRWRVTGRLGSSAINRITTASRATAARGAVSKPGIQYRGRPWTKYMTQSSTLAAGFETRQFRREFVALAGHRLELDRHGFIGGTGGCRTQAFQLRFQ